MRIALEGLAVTEIHAITTYLMDKSRQYVEQDSTPKIPEIAAQGDAARGKDLFSTKGCVACHNHKDHPSLKARSFGPDLSNVAIKFDSPEHKKWLVAWIKDPAFFNPKTFMPSLQLSDQDSADLAAYLVSVKGTWAQEVALPAVDDVALTDLVMSIQLKGKTSAQAKADVDKMSQEEKLFFLGEKTIGRLGCFGCHDIPGFENAKGIGVPLADWGKKDPHKLAFENIVEYIEKKLGGLDEKARAEHFYTKNDYYLWALGHHQREGFLMQKLREPRSYDYKKIRRWEDRARMPQFNLTDEERDAVATFVLGLVSEEVNRNYVFTPSPERQAAITGRNLLDRYNCTACHVIKPGEYRFTPSEEDAESIAALGKKELDADYKFDHSAWGIPPAAVNQGRNMVILGLPDGAEDPDSAENPDDPKSFVKLWSATSVNGQVIPAGLKLGIPKSQLTPANVTPAQGGVFAEQLVDFLLAKSPDAANPAERDKAWGKVPPPLIREGEKVQTPWLYRFLRDPVSIRPAAVLRMPKFNYRDGDVETLANYFAAADGVPYPYIEIPERQSSYLDAKNQAHPEYLEQAFRLITNKDLCIKCHPVGGYKPLGKPEELGPSLARAPERLRPGWMLHWIANPKRLLPYTGMPINFPPDKEQFQEIFKGSGMDQITAARDALINYNLVVDDIMNREQAAKTASVEKKGDNQ
ncbi:MAG: c-type cytochrome [Planctomycetota bacterium]